jgi:hypothetical protein
MEFQKPCNGAMNTMTMYPERVIFPFGQTVENSRKINGPTQQKGCNVEKCLSADGIGQLIIIGIASNMQSPSTHSLILFPHMTVDQQHVETNDNCDAATNRRNQKYIE